MPTTVPTQEDLDVIKLAFDDHLKIVDDKLKEYDGLPEREKHDFADLELRVKALEDKTVSLGHTKAPPASDFAKEAPYPPDDEEQPSPKSFKRHK